MNPNWWNCDDKQSVAGWNHQSRPTLGGKKHAEPYIIRLDVEEAAAEYRALPYRVQGLDRLLTDMLMAAEMFAFADEMQPPLKQNPPAVLSWLWNNLKSLVTELSIAGALAWLVPESAVALWIAGIVAGVNVLSVGFSLITAEGDRQQIPGAYRLTVGSRQPAAGIPGTYASCTVRKKIDLPN